MAQLQSPETYADGQQVTAARLNNQTNGAVALPGLITDQTNITANTVASGDSVLLYDLSATALREANVSDVLGSNLPVTTSAVTAGANSDIVVTPNDGTIVTGQAYTSGDGLTVTVTSTAHGLVVGQVILVTAAATGYNGTFQVATVATNSFTYVMTTAATAGSGSLSYTKKGTVKNTGNKAISGNIYVDGNAVITGTTIQTGAVTHTGNVTNSGNVSIAGSLTVAGLPASFVPSGAVMSFAMNSAPTGWLKCDGTLINRTTYAVLFSAIGTLYGAGDGSTTFKLPDLRGEFIRGFDDGKGTDSGRTIGSFQTDELKSHNHNILTAGATQGITSAISYVGNYYQNNVDSTIIVNTGSVETRPRNIAMLYCIKY
jgi:microcystin-dependent protein